MRTLSVLSAVLLAGAWIPLHAQEPVASAGAAPAVTPAAPTLKRAIEMALQNSKDIQAARIQANLGERMSLVTKAEFLPNVYAGSGLGYSYGIPETPGGTAPSIFSVTHKGQVRHEPLRGNTREG